MVRNQSPRAWLLARVAGLGDRGGRDRGVYSYKLAGLTPQLFIAWPQFCKIATLLRLPLWRYTGRNKRKRPHRVLVTLYTA